MSKSDDFENNLMKLIFNNVAFAQVASTATSSAFTNLQVSLHTADPGETGTQATSEASYAGYSRVATTRSTGATGWSVSANSASPVSAITFGSATSTSTATITHFAVGGSTSGATPMWYSGTVTPNINISQGVVAQLTTATAITED